MIMEDWWAVRERLENPRFWNNAERHRADIHAALERVEDYDAIRKERDYYAIEFSALTSGVPPGAKKTLLDTIRSLRQRVEELERELDRPKHETLRQLADAVERYGLMKQRAEAAEADRDDAYRAKHERDRRIGELQAEVSYLTRERDDARERLAAAKGGK